MKIRLVTVHPFDPWGSKIGGIETLIRSMLRNAPDDFKLELIGVTENPETRPVGRWNHMEFEGRPVSFYPLFPVLQPNERTRIPLFLKFSWKLRRAGFGDINAVFFYHRIEPLAMARIASRQSLLCIHGNPDEMISKQSEVKWKHAPTLYLRAEQKAIAKAHKVWVVSQKGKEVLSGRYPAQADCFSFLPTWYWEDIFHPTPEEIHERARQDLCAECKTSAITRFLLFAGRWEKQKNPLLVLDAFSIIKEKFPNVCLLMVGTGSLKPEVEARVKELKLEGQVLFPGAIEQDLLAHVMKGSDALLLASSFEGLPLIVLEAQASGLPVVATDTGEIKRIIKEGETGRIAEKMEAKWLAKGALDILNHPSRYRREACFATAEPYQSHRVLQTIFQSIRAAVD
ncbi:MAG: glycosyltransferase [bacterium]|nr:glycosyltransferase [bacterium]